MCETDWRRGGANALFKLKHADATNATYYDSFQRDLLDR